MKKFEEILIKLNNWKFAILIIVIVGASFYWFEIRPVKIYSKCINWYIKNHVKGLSVEESEFMYKICLRQNGINN